MYRLQFRRNSAMNAQEFAVNKAGQRKTVEHTHDTVINFLIVLAEALIMNRVHYCLKLKYDVSCRHS